jgi:hypothetical protein
MSGTWLQVDIDKPLGLRLAQSTASGGGCKVVVRAAFVLPSPALCHVLCTTQVHASLSCGECTVLCCLPGSLRQRSQGRHLSGRHHHLHQFLLRRRAVALRFPELHKLGSQRRAFAGHDCLCEHRCPEHKPPCLVVSVVPRATSRQCRCRQCREARNVSSVSLSSVSCRAPHLVSVVVVSVVPRATSRQVRASLLIVLRLFAGQLSCGHSPRHVWPRVVLGLPRCVQVKGENTSINVKRLPKKPAPKRFGRKLTAAQRELATHICVDCGYIYALK